SSRRRRPGSSPSGRARSFGDLLLLVLDGVGALAATELRYERRPLQAEQPRRGLLVPLRPPERFPDEPGLELLPRRVEVETFLAERRARDLLLGDEGADAGREMLDADLAVLGEDHETLEQVLQLAHVAGPVVLPEVYLRFLGHARG